MEESSIINLSNSQEKSEVEPPINDPEQETSTLVSPLPPSAEPEKEWGPIPSELFIKDDPDTYSPWAVIAVILGILSLLLMITTAFFGYQYFQNIQESASKDDCIKKIESFLNKVENFTRSMEKKQEEIASNIEIQLKNLSHILKMQKVNQGNHSQPCLNNCKQYKDNCYHQIIKAGSWFNFSDLCISMNSTFLQSRNNMLIDSMTIFVLNETRIGVANQKGSNEWKWIDGSPHPFPVSLKTEQNFEDSCVNPCTVNFYHCNKTLPCMCENPSSDS